jgi:AcrR family transcriptional regulator
MPAENRKNTQRARLLAGMIAAANRDGYAGANVAQVISHAGVSRPTFYDYFTDKDDCFLQTNRDIAERLLAQIRDAVADAPPERALQAAVRRVTQRAEAQPAQGCFLANATMAGGPRALDERDRTIGEIERIVQDARSKTPPGALSPDLPTRVAIGSAHWLLSPHLRRGQTDLTQLADEIVAWTERYEQPYREHRWHTLQPGPPPPSSPHVSELALHAPQPLAPGRSRLSSPEIARNQRERIMYATAELAAHKGYTATTIAEITRAAHVDQRVFYTHFRDKQQAFLAVHEMAIHQIFALGARAFFSAASWPERIWQGILASSQFQATYPSISHMGFVEAHAVGAPAIQRIEDSHRAFAIFLQEGNRHTPTPLSDTAMQAITAAVFEIGYHQTRSGRGGELSRHAHLATYLALAPYLGPQAANEFIDAKLRDTHPPQP